MILLDTHIWIWWVNDNEERPPDVALWDGMDWFRYDGLSGLKQGYSGD
jgi:hypothetical protein